MRRLVVSAVKLFVFFAILGRFLESLGLTRCPCEPDCWCKRPGLSLFRWVVPYGHRVRAES